MRPSTAQWQKSHPLENDQRPWRRKPPSTRSTVPVGARDVESWMLVDLPHTSCSAFGIHNWHHGLFAPEPRDVVWGKVTSIPISMTLAPPGPQERGHGSFRLH